MRARFRVAQGSPKSDASRYNCVANSSLFSTLNPRRWQYASEHKAPTLPRPLASCKLQQGNTHVACEVKSLNSVFLQLAHYVQRVYCVLCTVYCVLCTVCAVWQPFPVTRTCCAQPPPKKARTGATGEASGGVPVSLTPTLVAAEDVPASAPAPVPAVPVVPAPEPGASAEPMEDTEPGESMVGAAATIGELCSGAVST